MIFFYSNNIKYFCLWRLTLVQIFRESTFINMVLLLHEWMNVFIISSFIRCILILISNFGALGNILLFFSTVTGAFEHPYCIFKNTILLHATTTIPTHDGTVSHVSAHPSWSWFHTREQFIQVHWCFTKLLPVSDSHLKITITFSSKLQTKVSKTLLGQHLSINHVTFISVLNSFSKISNPCG